jgi:hypothetical protein
MLISNNTVDAGVAGAQSEGAQKENSQQGEMKNKKEGTAAGEPARKAKKAKQADAKAPQVMAHACHVCSCAAIQTAAGSFRQLLTILSLDAPGQPSSSWYCSCRLTARSLRRQPLLTPQQRKRRAAEWVRLLLKPLWPGITQTMRNDHYLLPKTHGITVSGAGIIDTRPMHVPSSIACAL